MKITIDILDEEYMPECPDCQKPININGELSIGEFTVNTVAICDNCYCTCNIELIVRQAKALKPNQ